MMRRRSFLAACGGSPVLVSWLRAAVARAAGADAPRRFIMVQRPNGTVPDQWIAAGAPGPILQALGDAWSWAVAVKGVDSPIMVNNHERGILGLMTGAMPGPTDRHGDDYRSTAESFDQTIVKRSPAASARLIPSLQLGCRDLEGGNIYLPNATMSYSGPATPLYPVIKPDAVYLRLFGAMTPASPDALMRERARRKSALDFVTADLARVQQQFPSAYRADLDLYASAIREVERTLDAGTASAPAAACAGPTIPPGLVAGGDYTVMEQIGVAMLALVQAAFACDLTRVVTFQWAPGFSSTNFKPLGTTNHHSTTHNGDAASRAVTTAIEKWFTQKTADFVRKLAAAPDPAGGALIDGTIVWYVNEVSDGLPHSGIDYPFVLFGGDRVGLKRRGRVLDTSGQKKTINDLWSSIGRAMGVELGPFTTPASGPVAGLFE